MARAACRDLRGAKRHIERVRSAVHVVVYEASLGERELCQELVRTLLDADRLREQGLLTAKEMSEALGISETTVHEWARSGMLRRIVCDSRNHSLYEPLRDATITKGHGEERPSQSWPLLNLDKVQYEARALSLAL